MKIRKYTQYLIGTYTLATTLIFGEVIQELSKNKTLRQVQTISSLDQFVKESSTREMKLNERSAAEFFRVGSGLLLIAPIALGFGIPFSYYLFNGDMESAPRGNDFILDA